METGGKRIEEIRLHEGDAVRVTDYAKENVTSRGSIRSDN